MNTCVARRTDAFVALALVHASGAVHAGSRSTSIILILTTHTSVVPRARAVQGVAKILAGATVHAGVTNAALGRCLASFAICARRTGTEEVLEEVDTKCIVLACRFVTAHFVLLALFTLPSNRALALKVSNQVSTLSTISARIGGTIINISLTEFTNITLPANTLELVVQIQTLQSSSWITRS